MLETSSLAASNPRGESLHSQQQQRCSSQGSIGVSISSSQPSASYHRENNRRLVNAESVARVCDIVEQSAVEFNAVNVATAFHRMAKLWNSPATGPSGAQMFQRADQCVRQLGELALVHLRCTPTYSSLFLDILLVAGNAYV